MSTGCAPAATLDVCDSVARVRWHEQEQEQGQEQATDNHNDNHGQHTHIHIHATHTKEEADSKRDESLPHSLSLSSSASSNCASSSTVTSSAPPVIALGWFERGLTLWVIICMVAGTSLGYYVPAISRTLSRASISQVDLPVAILVWLMIFPMSIRIEWKALIDVKYYWKGLILCFTTNWAIQPFIMFGLAMLFFKVFYANILSAATKSQYIAGACLLGGSPCTAMVFVWSRLAGGNGEYALVQVAINDLAILALYIPTLYLFLDIGNISMPYDTVILSVVIFVVVPFTIGAGVRKALLKYGGTKAIDKFHDVTSPITGAALLLTILLTFIYQGENIVNNWIDIILISIPLVLQTYLSFFLCYGFCYYLNVDYGVASTASFIAGSNFFELAIAIALSVFGASSGATLATICGVLTEVPVMLSLVWFAKYTRHRFHDRAQTIGVM